jgi:regulator of sigma E protease
MRQTTRRARSQATRSPRWYEGATAIRALTRQTSKLAPRQRNYGGACHTPAMSWVLTIIGIAGLVIVHELGHFLAAKAVGMRVERFSLFFAPKLVGVRVGETEYAIGSIPAGGYVKITGMGPHELNQIDLRVAHRAYYLQAPWKRIVVILAGPAMNLLVAFVIFWALLMSGNLGGALYLGQLDPHVRTFALSTNVLTVEKGAPASGKLRAADRILRVDGHPATVSTTRATIASHRCPGQLATGCRAQTPVRLTVLRGGRPLFVAIAPRYDRTARRMVIGVGFGQVRRFGVLGATTAAIREVSDISLQTITSLGRALTNSRDRHQVSSLIGITEVTHRAVISGSAQALVVIGLVSLALAVLNLLPFLPLDGGHVLWSVAEKIRGRRISLETMMRFSSVGLILLAFLVISGVSNDIGRLAG